MSDILSKPFFSIVRPHQILVRIEQHADHIIAQSHPQRQDGCLQSGSNIQGSSCFVFVTPDEEANVTAVVYPYSFVGLKWFPFQGYNQFGIKK